MAVNDKEHIDSQIRQLFHWIAQQYPIYIDSSSVRGAQSVGYEAMFSDDGNVLLVSQFCNSYGSDDEGRDIVFTFDKGDWRQVNSILMVKTRHQRYVKLVMQ